jgi:hypothetical protein
MKKILIIITLLVASSTYAVEDSPANRLREAERYVTATPPKELFADMAQQVAKTLPPEQRENFKATLTKNLDISALTKAMKDAMVKNFTADELKALADFYGSPVGKSAMKKFGSYMADVMPVVQAELMKAMAKTNSQMPDSKK